MAIVTCRECKKEVSDSAKTCPHCGATNPSLPIGGFWVFLIGAAIIALIVWWPFSKDDQSEPPQKYPSLSERFPGPWQHDAPGAIIVTLARNKTQGCGDFEHRPSIRTPDEYLVYCSKDGKSWVPYVVRTDTGEVWGPYTLDPTVPP
jgi:hypothetical protein